MVLNKGFSGELIFFVFSSRQCYFLVNKSINNQVRSCIATFRLYDSL